MQALAMDLTPNIPSVTGLTPVEFRIFESVRFQEGPIGDVCIVQGFIIQERHTSENERQE
jgi:hypothetical protein